MYNRHINSITYYKIVIASTFSSSSSDNQHKKFYCNTPFNLMYEIKGSVTKR